MVKKSKYIQILFSHVFGLSILKNFSYSVTNGVEVLTGMKSSGEVKTHM